jgi:hypothetical protein
VLPILKLLKENPMLLEALNMQAPRPDISNIMKRG